MTKDRTLYFSRVQSGESFGTRLLIISLEPLNASSYKYVEEKLERLLKIYSAGVAEELNEDG